MKGATVIIPTTGAPVVRQAIESCLASTYSDLDVLTVVDGAQYRAAFERHICGITDPRLQTVVLAQNVGGEEFYGHRIYAGFSHLVNAHHILFLDQDNFYEPDHIEKLIAKIAKGNLDWSYALRRICDFGGDFIANDDGESLGEWSSNDGGHLIDTSCFCLTQKTAANIASTWHGKVGQDRVVTHALLKHFPRYACSGAYTVNYRLHEAWQRPFFEEANRQMQARYPDGFPWARSQPVPG